MPKRQPLLGETPVDVTQDHLELDLHSMFAGRYVKIDGHWWYVADMSLMTRAAPPVRPGEDPVRDMEQVDLKLVHARWKDCDV